MINAHSIKKQFEACMRWNLGGSIVYELFKTIHHFFLLRTLDISLYGLVGSTFGTIYLATKFADVGTTYTIPPFLHLLIKNKKNFLKIFFLYIFFPQVPFIFITAFATTFFFSKQLLGSMSLMLWFTIFGLICLETVRSFLRYFLHFIFKSKLIIMLEVSSFCLYLITIWFFIYPRNGYKLELYDFFLPHFVESITIVILFSIITYGYYRKIQQADSAELPPKLARRILEIRFFNYVFRISRDFFTSNFITPLFALKFGFNAAGLFYFVGTFATSLQAIIKAAINYSGYALLAGFKEGGQQEKKEAFTLLSQKLLFIIVPVVIFLVPNYRSVMQLGGYHSQATTSFSFFFIFLGIIVIEFWSQLYEQFYIIEEASRKLFLFRVLEFVLFYFFVIADQEKNPATMLLRIALIKAVSFSIVAINAYATWRIKITLSTKVSYLLICSIFSSCFFLLFRYFSKNII